MSRQLTQRLVFGLILIGTLITMTPIVLIESVANILLFTHAINEDSRRK